MRLPALLAASAALAVAVLIASFTTSAGVRSQAATTTLPAGLIAIPDAVFPTFPLPPGTLAFIGSDTTTPAATSSTSTTPPPPKPKTPLIVVPQKNTPPAATVPKNQPTLKDMVAATTTTQDVTPSPPAPDPQLTQAGLDTAATALRSALVNIICVPQSGTLQSISGSGVIIDSKGIILTNAHIGQYFLLRDYPTPNNTYCVIRTGSPARPAYDAKLIFISSAWIHGNPNTLTETNPTGNGEFDIALLAITKSYTSTPLPSSFPYIPLETTTASIGNPIVIGSYAAQFLTSSQVASTLYQTVVFGSIKNVFTYETNSVDAISLGGTVAAQEGSSGGGIVDTGGKLVGTITTSTVQGDTSTRELRAITEAYVARDYMAEAGSALSSLLAQPISVSINAFASKIPDLEAVITKGLTEATYTFQAQ